MCNSRNFNDTYVCELVFHYCTMSTNSSKSKNFWSKLKMYGATIALKLLTFYFTDVKMIFIHFISSSCNILFRGNRKPNFFAYKIQGFSLYMIHNTLPWTIFHFLGSWLTFPCNDPICFVEFYGPMGSTLASTVSISCHICHNLLI